VPLHDPVPAEVRSELQRVVARWHQLPVDHALRCMPDVRTLLVRLSSRTVAAPRASGPAPASPAHCVAPDDPSAVAPDDLGPGVVMDQLTVLVFDACAAGIGQRLEGELAELRRALG